MVTFAIIAVVMVVGALGVVFLREPIHAALSLVGTLLTAAVAYLLLDASFLAAIQVIVYAGAIMVLFLFVLMLLNVQYAVAEASRDNGIKVAAGAAALLIAVGIAVVAFWDGRPLPDLDVVRANLQGGGAGGIADALFGELLLAFHLVSVLLLTGVVGAVALVQRRAQSAHGALKVTDGADAHPSLPSRPLGGSR
jgi:NADH-quinone oxidoreductase subunit J